MPQESPKAPSTSQSKTRKTTSKKTPKGLGDSIEKLTKKTGIDKIVKAVVGEDCGCDKRKEWLNQRFPYAKPMTEEDKRQWEAVLAPALKKNHLGIGEQNLAIDIYERVFARRKRKSRCGSCVKSWMEELKKAYEASCDE